MNRKARKFACVQGYARSQPLLYVVHPTSVAPKRPENKIREKEANYVPLCQLDGNTDLIEFFLECYVSRLQSSLLETVAKSKHASIPLDTTSGRVDDLSRESVTWNFHFGTWILAQSYYSLFSRGRAH